MDHRRLALYVTGISTIVLLGLVVLTIVVMYWWTSRLTVVPDGVEVLRSGSVEQTDAETRAVEDGRK